MDHPSVEGFWWFVQERERVRLRKQAGQSPPWTDDPTLQQYHFCNIRRAEDFGTQWYVQNVAAPILIEPVRKGDLQADWQVELIWRTIFYRLVNNVAWFEHFGDVGFGYEHWRRIKRSATKRILAMPKPYSPAYIVLQDPTKRSRAERLVAMLNDLQMRIKILTSDLATSPTLEGAWKRLQTVYGVGPFIALQVVRDLMLVDFLPSAWEDTFTYIGPGAKRGLHLLNIGGSYKALYFGLQMLWAEQPVDPPLVLGDVEHCLCEYAKFVVYREGGGRRRRYDFQHTRANS